MKSRRQTQQHDDSTWKIVYMDMITVLMVMFLTLWLSGKNAPEKDKKGGDVTENRITIPADDFFDTGHATLKPEARTRIRQIFLDREIRLPSPGREGRDRILYVIEGYTDSQGEKTSNFELGFNRAMAVYNELSDSGKLPEFSQNVSICSHADNKAWRPDVDGKIESSKSINAASSLALTPDLLRRRNRRVSVKLETLSDYFNEAKDELEE
ncbi:MAG: flagellar motor protein MotB [Bdellovibrionia bacterium]